MKFDFTTLNTYVSEVLLGLPSVREPFLDILAKHQGLCGLFDVAGDEYEVFWLEGQQLDPPVKMTEEQISARLQATKL